MAHSNLRYSGNNDSDSDSNKKKSRLRWILGPYSAWSNVRYYLRSTINIEYFEKKKSLSYCLCALI